MRYSKIRRMDISNGPGYRVSLFTQGCSRHCPGCFNQDTWDYNGGKEYTQETEDLIMDLVSNPNVVGLSILGGEPLSACNIEPLLSLFKTFKSKFPTKTIWLWTGYEFDNMPLMYYPLVDYVDGLVTGPYDKSKHDITLKYAGSSNQELWLRHHPAGYFSRQSFY